MEGIDKQSYSSGYGGIGHRDNEPWSESEREIFGRLLKKEKEKGSRLDSNLDESTQNTDIYTERFRFKTSLYNLCKAASAKDKNVQSIIKKLMPSSTVAKRKEISNSITTEIGCTESAVENGSETNIERINKNLTVDRRQKKRTKFQTQQLILLFDSIRRKNDEVAMRYKSYLLNMRKVAREGHRREHVQKVLQEFHGKQKSEEIIELEYWQEVAERNFLEAISCTKNIRKALVDITGTEAVQNLDEILKSQFLKESDSK